MPKVTHKPSSDGSPRVLIGIKGSEKLRQRMRIAMAELDLHTYFDLLHALLDIRDDRIRKQRAGRGEPRPVETPEAVAGSPLHRRGIRQE